ncbi:izumo sperm-egg fusion protein 1 isoform X2 [Vanacampus margaritifer]
MMQWWTTVLMLCCNTVIEACLQCDKEIQDMHNNIFPQLSINRQKAIRDGYGNYKATSQKQNGVMDPTTMYRVKTEYQNVFDSKYKNKKGTDPIEFFSFLNEGNLLIEEFLTKFMTDGLCPNKCGILQRQVLDCVTCKYKIHICPSPSGSVDCGVHKVKAKEGTQELLDCFQPWHSTVFKRRECQYTWTMDVNGKRMWNYTVQMEDTEMVLNQLSLRDQGMYKCSLIRQNGTVFYRVQWHVTVTRVQTTTHPPLFTLPAESPEDDSLLQRAMRALVPLMSVVTTLSLAGSLVFIAVMSSTCLMCTLCGKGDYLCLVFNATSEGQICGVHDLYMIFFPLFAYFFSCWPITKISTKFFTFVCDSKVIESEKLLYMSTTEYYIFVSITYFHRNL